MHHAKFIYPKYSRHWLSTLAHTIDFVCSRILNHGLNLGLLFSLWVKKQSKLIWKFRVKISILILLDISVLLDVQANLPETSPFLSAQMTLVGSFFQMFIALGMYNFGIMKKLPPCFNSHTMSFYEYCDSFSLIFFFFEVLEDCSCHKF